VNWGIHHLIGVRVNDELCGAVVFAAGGAGYAPGGAYMVTIYTPDPAPQAIHGLTIQTLHKIKKRRLGCAEIQVRKERGGREDQPERFRMFRYVAILTFVILISVSSATLAQNGDRSQDRRACRDDARRLCAGIARSSGRGAVLECLAGQKDKLSDECRRSVESRGK
jgi:hypothetical protein